MLIVIKYYVKYCSIDAIMKFVMPSLMERFWNIMGGPKTSVFRLFSAGYLSSRVKITEKNGAKYVPKFGYVLQSNDITKNFEGWLPQCRVILLLYANLCENPLTRS